MKMETVEWRSPTGTTAVTEKTSLTSSFLKWCSKSKLMHPKCTIGTLANTGRCVLATKDIKLGEIVVEVPDDIVLMAENCSIGEELESECACILRPETAHAHCSGAPLCMHKLGLCLRHIYASQKEASNMFVSGVEPPYPTLRSWVPWPAHYAVAGMTKETSGGDAAAEVQGLVLAVMCEAQLGKKSAWAPYLAWVPRDMSHMPMSWTVSVATHLHSLSTENTGMCCLQHVPCFPKGPDSGRTAAKQSWVKPSKRRLGHGLVR